MEWTERVDKWGILWYKEGEKFKLQFIGLLGCSYARGCWGRSPQHPKGTAGSAEGGLERLGAHR